MNKTVLVMYSEDITESSATLMAQVNRLPVGEEEVKSFIAPLYITLDALESQIAILKRELDGSGK